MDECQRSFRISAKWNLVNRRKDLSYRFCNHACLPKLSL